MLKWLKWIFHQILEIFKYAETVQVISDAPIIWRKRQHAKVSAGTDICGMMITKTPGSMSVTSRTATGGFLKWGYPHLSSIYRWIFPYQPSSYWGSPMTTWKPHQNWKANGRDLVLRRVHPASAAVYALPASTLLGVDAPITFHAVASRHAASFACVEPEAMDQGWSRAFLKTGPKFYQGNHGKSAIFPYKSTPLWSWKPVLGILCWLSLHDQGCSFHFRYVAFFIPEVLKIANIQANGPAIITILSARVAGASPSFRTASTTLIPQHHRTRYRIPTSSKWWRGKMKEIERVEVG